MKEESGDGGKKKKQKIGQKLMNQNEKELLKIFNLVEGFQYQTFNNLALDKIRIDTDNAQDLGKIKQTICFPKLLCIFFS